jgi:hypothetical protein
MTSRSASLRVASSIPSQRATVGLEDCNSPRNASATVDLKALALQVIERNRLRNACATTPHEARNNRATTTTLEGRSSEREASVALSAGIETQRATLSVLSQAVAEEIGRHPRGIGDLKLKQIFWQRRVQANVLEESVAEFLAKGLVARLASDPHAFAVASQSAIQPSWDFAGPRNPDGTQPERGEVVHG